MLLSWRSPRLAGRAPTRQEHGLKTKYPSATEADSPAHAKREFQVTEIRIHAIRIDRLDHQLARSIAMIGADRDVRVHAVIGAGTYNMANPERLLERRPV